MYMYELYNNIYTYTFGIVRMYYFTYIMVQLKNTDYYILKLYECTISRYNSTKLKQLKNFFIL